MNTETEGDTHEFNAKSFEELYVEAYEKILKPVESSKFGKRFTGLDKITGGFRPREFSILCGSTGTGKTTLLANWSAALLEQRTPHFVASVETGPHDFIIRVMSALAEKDFNTGEPIPVEEVKKFHVDHGSLIKTQHSLLSLYENRFSVDTLISNLRTAHEEFGCKVALIDNLNFFLEVTSVKDQIVEMDRVIHDLIIFCKQINMHIVMVMHPKKTDNTRVQSEFDIKGSSTAVQEAHNVFLFNRPDPALVQANQAEITDRELKIAKMRRRGLSVGGRLILNSIRGVTYREGKYI